MFGRRKLHHDFVAITNLRQTKKTFSFVVGEKKFNEAKWRRKDENKTKMEEEEIKKKGRKELKRSNLGLAKVQWNVKQHFHLLIMMAIFTCPPPLPKRIKKCWTGCCQFLSIVILFGIKKQIVERQGFSFNSRSTRSKSFQISGV